MRIEKRRQCVYTARKNSLHRNERAINRPIRLSIFTDVAFEIGARWLYATARYSKSRDSRRQIAPRDQVEIPQRKKIAENSTNLALGCGKGGVNRLRSSSNLYPAYWHPVSIRADPRNNAGRLNSRKFPARL